MRDPVDRGNYAEQSDARYSGKWETGCPEKRLPVLLTADFCGLSAMVAVGTFSAATDASGFATVVF